MKFLLPVMLIFLTLSPIYAADSRQLIQKGDELYSRRGDVREALAAYEAYKAALKIHPNHYEALWKLAKTAFYLCEVLTDKKQKKPIVEEAIRCAKKAVEVKPNGVEGHFWLGVNYTKLGEVKGVLKSLFLVSPTKKEMRKAIEIDDTYEGAGAYVVLGRIYSQVPGIFGGSNKKARQNFEKARHMSPKNSMNLLFLAETYWDIDKNETAIKTLEDLIAMEPDPRWLPEYERHKKEALKMLKKYKEDD